MIRSGMARKRAQLDFKNEASQIRELLKTTKEVWKKDRLLGIDLLLRTDQTYEAVAETIGCHESSVRTWAKTFRQGGLKELLTRGNGGGRKTIAKEKALEELTEKLRIGAFRTAGQAQRWLEEEHGVVYGKNSIYYVLGKLGGRLKVPRPCHQKKVTELEEEFRTTLAEKMEKLAIPRDKKVVLWVYDEMRYGLHPLLRKVWSLTGTRVTAQVNRRFKWGYLTGAISVKGGQSEFLYTDGISKELDLYFLQQISRNDTEKVHVIIGDGAGFHQKEGQVRPPEMPDNVHVLTLPAYSPELNPIEKLWDIVKDGICNVNWPSMEELEKHMTVVLESLWSRAEGFSSLFTNSYLRTELNVS